MTLETGASLRISLIREQTQSFGKNVSAHKTYTLTYQRLQWKT